MKTFIHYLKGYTIIDAYGDYVERLLSICVRNGIYIWNIVNVDSEHIVFSIYVKDYVRLKPVIHKLHIRCKHRALFGLKYSLINLLKKLFFIIFCFLFILVLYFLKTRIWSINIQGNNTISEQEIVLFLKNQGIEPGTYIYDIPYEELENLIKDYFPQITWISVGLDQTQLQIKIIEEIVPFKKDEISTMCSSLYAKADGTVLDMVVRCGTPAVKVGENVKAGDLLVSGVLSYTAPNGLDTFETRVNADADFSIQYEKSEIVYINTKDLYSDFTDTLWFKYNLLRNINQSVKLKSLNKIRTIGKNKYVYLACFEIVGNCTTRIENANE